MDGTRLPRGIQGYFRGRVVELARPETRAAAEPLAEWARRRIRLDGKPFSFEGHEYLRAIYDDASAHVVLCKAAQIGGTTWGILRSLHACLMGLNVGYYFPTKTDVLEFSKSRVSPLLADNAFLSKMLKDTDTAGLKRIGEAYLYLRGMQSTVGMKSIPVDMLVFDELDEATPESKSLARERLAHSDYKRIIELSNPSLPDYGIDEPYQASDQRHWMLKCPACGTWTCLEKEFPKKVGEEVKIILPRPDGSFYRACVKCSGELDLGAGEWVAEFPDRPVHGYRISQLFSSKVDPGEILREYRTTHYPDRFYNLKIGIPWADLDLRLDAQSVLGLCSEYPMRDGASDTAMGVDTGRQLHVVILRASRPPKEGKELIHLAVCDTFQQLDDLMTRFGVLYCVIDGLPETHATRAFAGRHPGRVLLNFFNENQRGSAAWNFATGIVQINRTEALDASRAAVRDKQLALPRRNRLVEQFAQHMAADAKLLDEDEETGARKYRYIRTGPDHFSLALTYAWMAARWIYPPTDSIHRFAKCEYDPFADEDGYNPFAEEEARREEPWVIGVRDLGGCSGHEP
ncbi:MAG: phage terminase large subunit family protein [Thermoanaerobaculia bacterium]